MSRTLGAEYENQAVEYLKHCGYTIIERNYTVRGAEIDIIASIGDIIVFVEVKARKNTYHGYPREYVTKAKRSRIIHGIKQWLYENEKYSDAVLRIDVIEIINRKIQHIENAFGEE